MYEFSIGTNGLIKFLRDLLLLRAPQPLPGPEPRPGLLGEISTA
uniref:Uncharacterized protein n=1 Tax=Arundo donax TaxID=35708 RepID=A0A0A9F294_ARUDO